MLTACILRFIPHISCVFFSNNHLRTENAWAQSTVDELKVKDEIRASHRRRRQQQTDGRKFNNLYCSVLKFGVLAHDLVHDITLRMNFY